MVTLRPMTEAEFVHYSLMAYEDFVTQLAKFSGQALDVVRKTAGGPPTLTVRDLWRVIQYKNIDVGFIWLRLLSETIAFGYHIFVNEEYRNQGIGKQAMFAVHMLLSNMGIKKLKLCVFKGNTIAHQIYKDFGFLESNFNQERSQYTLEIDIVELGA